MSAAGSESDSDVHQSLPYELHRKIVADAFGQQSVRLSWEKVTKLIITSSTRRTERSLWMLLIEIRQQQLTHTQTVQRSARKEVRCASGGHLPQLLVLTTLGAMHIMAWVFKFLQDAELCGHAMATGNWCTQYACMMSQKKYWAFLDN